MKTKLFLLLLLVSGIFSAAKAQYQTVFYDSNFPCNADVRFGVLVYDNGSYKYASTVQSTLVPGGSQVFDLSTFDNTFISTTVNMSVLVVMWVRFAGGTIHVFDATGSGQSGLGFCTVTTEYAGYTRNGEWHYLTRDGEFKW